MKRTILIGTTFLMAAVLGFGIVAGLAPSTQAETMCIPDGSITFVEKRPQDCPQAPHLALMRCDLEQGTQELCNCELIRCYFGFPF